MRGDKVLDRGQHRTEPDIDQRLGDQEQREGKGDAVGQHADHEQRHADHIADRRHPGIIGLVAAAQPVAQKATEQDAGHPADQQQSAQKLSRAHQVQAETAHQQAGQPEGDAITAHRTARRAQRQQPEAALGRQYAEYGADRHGVGGLNRAGGFAHDQAESGCDQDAEQPHDDEGGAPFDRLRDIAAQQHAARRPQRDAQRIDGQRPRALVRREIVGNHRIGWRDPARFADAHADAEQEHLHEAGRHAAQRRKTAPDGKADGDHPGAAGPVGQQCQRNCQRRIEQREGDAAQSAKLRIAKLQVRLDRHGQYAQNLPVEKIERIDQQQHRQHDGAVSGGCGLFGHALTYSHSVRPE